MSKRNTSGSKRFRRSAGPINRGPSILIVTEGKKSEVDYFKRLRRQMKLPRSSVLIQAGKRSDPTHIVNTTKNLLTKQKIQFQSVFCVFDRDDHSRYEEALKDLEDLGKRNDVLCENIVAITSVPCFEYWYFLHVSDSRKAYGTYGSPCSELEKDLRQYEPFQNYEKSSCDSFFHLIWKNRKVAMQRSKMIFENPFSESYYSEDPSTRVHLVLEEFEKLERSTSK